MSKKFVVVNGGYLLHKSVWPILCTFVFSVDVILFNIPSVLLLTETVRRNKDEEGENPKENSTENKEAAISSENTQEHGEAEIENEKEQAASNDTTSPADVWVVRRMHEPQSEDDEGENEEQETEEMEEDLHAGPPRLAGHNHVLPG